MRKLALILIICAVIPAASVALYPVNCHLKESAFQARTEQLRRDAHLRLKVGTNKEEVIRFFSENGLRTSSDASTLAGFIFMSRGCGRGLGCSIGPDGGEIAVIVTLDALGTVISEPVVRNKYSGDCS